MEKCASRRRLLTQNGFEVLGERSLGAAEDYVEGKEAHHGDAACDFTDCACKQAYGRAESCAAGFFSIATAGHFENRCADEGAEKDSRKAEEDTDERANDGACGAAPGRAQFFRAVNGGEVIHDEGQGGDQAEDQQDPPRRAGRAEVQFVADRGGHDERRARNAREDAPGKADEHDHKGNGQADDLFGSHVEKITRNGPAAVTILISVSTSESLPQGVSLATRPIAAEPGLFRHCADWLPRVLSEEAYRQSPLLLCACQEPRHSARV